VLVEAATDNPTRTVANVRMYFNRGNGALGKTGSLDFVFTRKGVFTLDSAGLNAEDLELELIDFGLDHLEKNDDGEMIIYTAFTDYGKMQKALEDKNIAVKKSGLERIPTSLANVTEEQIDEVLELVEKLEADDDVQAVYHNLS
jgi:transcriptional/translational regulatory protein YebC/TACO1